MKYNRTVLGYYAYRATTSHGFWVPVGTLYLVQSGYTLDVVGLANAVLVFAIVCAEIPAGYAADRIGRRASLAIGNGVTAFVMGAYVLAGSGTAYVVLFGLWGVGFAFHSAIGEAWLYDLLDGHSSEEKFAHISGRGETAELAVGAIASLSAAALYAVNPAIPFLANAALAASGIPILAILPASQGGVDDRLSVREVLDVLGAQLRRPEVRWMVAYMALFNVLFSMTRWLEQPALDTIGVPVAGLGILYAVFRLVSAAATSTTGWLRAQVGSRRFFGLLIPLCGLAYASIAVVPAAAVPVIMLRRTVDRVAGPLRDHYINERLSGFGRATVLSGVSMALHLASGLGNLVAGRLAAVAGPFGFLPMAGIGISALAGLLWLSTSPVREVAVASGLNGKTANPGD